PDSKGIRNSSLFFGVMEQCVVAMYEGIPLDKHQLIRDFPLNQAIVLKVQQENAESFPGYDGLGYLKEHCADNQMVVYLEQLANLIAYSNQSTA
ncbi:MAG: hypothetical protein AAFY76_20665, partial [Cyanobacteria bacterium J06649_11]